MNILRRFSLLTLSITAMFVVPTVAQRADTSSATDTAAPAPVQELERMVVTATKTERAISAVPVSVSVIERADVDIMPAQGIDDLIMRETGVTVKRVVGMAEGIPSDIIVRGVPGAFAASRVLILVDGIPTNVAGTPLQLLKEVPLQCVDRIEVLRGPFSSLYGANAFAGAINVFSREPERAQELSVYHKLWPLHYSQVGIRNGGSFEHVDYAIGGDYLRVDNVLGTDSALVRVGETTTHDTLENYDYQQGRMLSKVRFWLGDKASITVHGRLFGSDLGFGKSQNSLRAELRMKGRRMLAGPYLDWAVSDKLELYIGGYGRRTVAEFYNVAYDRTADVLVPSYWKSIVDDGTVEARATVRLGETNTLTAGVDYLENQVLFGATEHRGTGEQLYPSRDERIGNLGVYLQDEIRLWERFVALPGVRVDYHSLMGAVVSPKLACSYRFAEPLRTRVSVGRAFRAPTMVELYMPATELFSGVTMVPTPDLKPEYIVSLDGGVDVTLGTR
ncbi:MAG: TonB-dependent receptor, partial [Chitinivibrionales bacterium]|nr:TonB-dependent receptor [Chitinivibrionales bacterium]